MGKRKHRHRHNGTNIEIASEPVAPTPSESTTQIRPSELGRSIGQTFIDHAMAAIDVERTFDIESINALLNHPTIYPSITIPGREGPIDITELVVEHHNFFMMAPGGVIAFIRDEPGIYEVHTNFLPEYRGRNALRASIAAYRWMFTHTDCMILETKVPGFNVAADMFCRLVGATKEFTRPGIWPTDKGLVDLAFWQLHYHDWVRRDPSVAMSGRRFHEKLEAERIRHNLEEPLHPDEECHDRYVGACVEMVYAGQPDKGVVLYNRWSSFAGYGKIALIARIPLVLDIGDAVLQVIDCDFKVLKFK